MSEIGHFPEENSEQINDYVRRYWLFDGRVVVYEPRGDDRQMVDAWYDIALEVGQAWDGSKPFISIHDFREASITLYAQHRARELVSNLGQLTGHTIIVTKNDINGNLINLFVNMMSSRFQPTIKRHAFTNFHKAQMHAAELLGIDRLAEE